MRLEHHLVGGYVRYISPHIIIIISKFASTLQFKVSNYVFFFVLNITVIIFKYLTLLQPQFHSRWLVCL